VENPPTLTLDSTTTTIRKKQEKYTDEAGSIGSVTIPKSFYERSSTELKHYGPSLKYVLSDGYVKRYTIGGVRLAKDILHVNGSNSTSLISVEQQLHDIILLLNNSSNNENGNSNGNGNAYGHNMKFYIDFSKNTFDNNGNNNNE
jgi:hypothetical protein